MQKKNVLDICFSVAVEIILLIVTVNIINTLGWLVKISITPFHLPLAFILSSFINYLIQCKIIKIRLKDYIISLITFILIFIISLGIVNMFLDVSYDGAWYHSIAIIRLKEGWNPIYEYINSGQFGDVYIDSYANKSIWGFGATVLALFNNLNTTKIISTLVAFAVSFLALKIFGEYAKKKIHWLIIIVLSLTIGFNPIVLSQIFSNYIDSTLGLYTIFYCLLFMLYYLKQKDFNNLDFSILIACLIALMVNTKLTGLFFAASFFGFYVMVEMLILIKNKKFNFSWFKKMFITGFSGLLLAFFIGINPFITNVIHGHNIFYPILGSEKIEVMGANVPESIRSKNNLEKLLIVNFSRTSNSTNFLDTKLQVPFVIDWNDYQNINFDTRIGAFGPLFSTIILIVIISILLFSKVLIKKDKNLLKKTIFSSCLYILLIAIIFNESWWGRYYSILWIIPILIAIYYLYSNNKKMNIVACLLSFLIILNVFNVGKSVYDSQINKSRKTMDYIATLKGKNIMFWCFDDLKKWDYSYLEYFKEKGINAISADKYIENSDFENYNIQIKILKD